MDDIKKHYKVLSEIKDENKVIMELNRALNGQEYDQNYQEIVNSFLQLDKSVEKEIQNNGCENFMKFFLEVNGKNPQDHQELIQQMNKQRNEDLKHFKK